MILDVYHCKHIIHYANNNRPLSPTIYIYIYLKEERDMSTYIKIRERERDSKHKAIPAHDYDIQ
jgi:hypothetical protein